MNKNIRLNQKAFARVIDDLVRSGFVRSTVTKDETRGRVSRHTHFTKRGKKLIASYANAMVTIQNPTQRKIDAFGSFVTSTAIDYLRQTGKIVD